METVGVKPIQVMLEEVVVLVVEPGGAGTAGQFAGGTDNSLASPNYPQGGGGSLGGVGQDAYQTSGDGTEVPGDFWITIFCVWRT